MKKVFSVILVLALVLGCVVFTVSADAKSPVETIPAVFNTDCLKGMIGNLVFGTNYTITAADKGVKIDGAAGRSAYERVEVRGLWTLDGLRIEMADVNTKSSLMVCLVDSVGGFPTGGKGKAVGLDPTSNKLWITGEGDRNIVLEGDTTIEPSWSNGTAPAIAGNYTIQFNKTSRGCWIVTVNDCAAYEVPAATFDSLLDGNGQTMISFVSNAAYYYTEDSDKTVSFTVTKFIENVAVYPEKTIPAVRTQSDLKGMIGKLAFGTNYTISAVSGGIKVDGAAARSVYERVEVVGLWTLDGLRIEMADVNTKSSLMVCLVDSVGGFPTGGKGKAVGLDPTSNKLWITGEGANNIVLEGDTTIEPSWSNGLTPAIAGNYTIQFNKTSRGCWIVTVNDCAAYVVPAATFDSLLDANGQTMVSFVSNAAYYYTEDSDKTVSFTVTKFVEYVAAYHDPADPSLDVQDIQMLSGAAVRFAAPTGLRFTTRIAGLDALIEAGYTVKAGTLICPADYLDGIEFTAAALKGASKTYLDIVNEKWNATPEDGVDYYETNAVIYNIKTANYNRPFAARAYVDVTDNLGMTIRYYGTFDATQNVRSVYAVARAALDDPQGGYSEAQRASLQVYTDYVESL